MDFLDTLVMPSSPPPASMVFQDDFQDLSLGSGCGESGTIICHNEHPVCTNCCVPFSDSINKNNEFHGDDESTFEEPTRGECRRVYQVSIPIIDTLEEDQNHILHHPFDIENQNVKVIDMLSSIYKLDLLNHLEEAIEDNQKNIPLCPSCADALTCSYKAFEYFNKLRRMDSFIAQNLVELDHLITSAISTSVGNKDSNFSNVITTASNSNRNPSIRFETVIDPSLIKVEMQDHFNDFNSDNLPQSQSPVFVPVFRQTDATVPDPPWVCLTRLRSSDLKSFSNNASSTFNNNSQSGSGSGTGILKGKQRPYKRKLRPVKELLNISSTFDDFGDSFVDDVIDVDFDASENSDDSSYTPVQNSKKFKFNVEPISSSVNKFRRASTRTKSTVPEIHRTAAAVPKKPVQKATKSKKSSSKPAVPRKSSTVKTKTKVKGKTKSKNTNKSDANSNSTNEEDEENIFETSTETQSQNKNLRASNSSLKKDPGIKSAKSRRMERKRVKGGLYLAYLKRKEKAPCPCVYCLLDFQTETERSDHVRSAHMKRKKYMRDAKNPIVCDPCGTFFVIPARFTAHLPKCGLPPDNMPLPPYICPHCSRELGTHWALNNHVKFVHLTQPTFACDQGECTYKAKTRSLLIHHKETTHKESEFFPCHLCPAILKSTNHYRQHYERMHTEEGRKKYEEYSQKASIRGKEKRRKNALTSFICQECNVDFQTKMRLTRHNLAEHVKEKKYMCDQCGKGFINAYRLKKHIQFAHTEERPWICDQCGKSFKTVQNLKFHIKTTHDEEGRRKYNEQMRENNRRRMAIAKQVASASKGDEGGDPNSYGHSKDSSATATITAAACTTTTTTTTDSFHPFQIHILPAPPIHQFHLFDS